MSATSSPRHLLIPFAHHGSPACQEALKSLQLPRLRALLEKLEAGATDTQDDTTLSPPHERALAQALGLTHQDGLIPWAALEARRAGLEGAQAPDGEGWGIATLCHWQVGIDDVVLGDPGAIRIDAAESAALLTAARPFFEGDQIALFEGGAPGRWLVRGRVFADLPTASVDRAAGQPIARWSPLDGGAASLRRLQNEMQMLLYTERVNDARTARGEPAINSFWLSGTGRLPGSFVLEGGATSPPRVASELRGPALAGDGAAWARAWEAIDAGPVAEWLAACQAGEQVLLTLCGDKSAQRFERPARSLSRWARSLFRRTDTAAVLESLS